MGAILGFRTSTYARNIYMFGTNRLTARDGFSGVAGGYYTPSEQYTASNYTKANIDNALAMTWINDQEYDETLALITLTTPLAPNVAADDENNVVTGIYFGMEYALDGATDYTVYDGYPLSLDGDHTVKVRVSAIPYVNNASDDAVLTFTTNVVAQ